jgi:hypothetical protein
MNDLRKRERGSQNHAAPKLCKPFGGGAWEPKVGRRSLASSWPCRDLAELMIGPATGRGGSIPAAGHAMSATQQRQSRLNTTEASQPVMTAIIAVTTP